MKTNISFVNLFVLRIHLNKYKLKYFVTMNYMQYNFWLAHSELSFDVFCPIFCIVAYFYSILLDKKYCHSISLGKSLRTRLAAVTPPHKDSWEPSTSHHVCMENTFVPQNHHLWWKEETAISLLRTSLLYILYSSFSRWWNKSSKMELLYETSVWMTCWGEGTEGEVISIMYGVKPFWSVMGYRF